MLVRIYRSQGRVADAIKELDALISQQPRLVGAQVLKAMLLDASNRRSEAIQHYKKALDIDPHAAVAANNLAWLYADAGENLDEALSLARTAKAQLPESVDVSDTLAWVFYKKGMFDLAIGTLQDVARAHPDRGDVQLHLGLAYLKSGDILRARTVLRGAAKLNLAPAQAAEARAALEQLGG
jgi:tetratricopeptide (TPR) repeat protein